MNSESFIEVGHCFRYSVDYMSDFVGNDEFYILDVRLRYLGSELIPQKKPIFDFDWSQQKLYGCLSFLEVRVIVFHDKEYNLNLSKLIINHLARIAR